jgi:hypothetical protein
MPFKSQSDGQARTRLRRWADENSRYTETLYYGVLPN